MTSITTLPLDHDPALVRAALRDADIPVLLMVVVQLTGDLSLLDSHAPLLGRPGEFSHSLPQEMVDALLDRLTERLTRGGPAPDHVEPSVLHRMMTAFVQEDISELYMPMLMEDLGFRTPPAPLAAAGAETAERAAGFKVLVIGAGASGICAGIRLKQAGIAFEIVERNDDVGGVWHENTYPGCGVDSANHLYCYSFELNHDWSRYYVKQPELRDYLRDCARKHGVMDHVHLNQEVQALAFDEEGAVWHATIRQADGSQRRVVANAVISSVGQLNQPAYPPLKGLDGFAGHSMHTARWDHGIDLRGKSVAMIGTGASGMQVAPAIADDVARLTIFQRSAPWVLPRHNYHNTVTENVKWVLANVPFYARWYRFMLFWAYGDGVYPLLKIDRNWHQPGSISARNAEIRAQWTKYVEAEVGDRPDLFAKVLPDYPPYGKRSLRDNDWYRTLRRDKVELVNTPVAEIVPGGIIDCEGRHYPVDVIIYATGFLASRMLHPMDIVGKGGTRLRDIWGDDNPRAYLGITMPGFPNLFLTYGPNTNLAHGGSIIFQAECQVHYITTCLAALIEGGHDAMECTAEAYDDYNASVDATLDEMVWAFEGVTNWYKNASGRVTTNSPWSLVDYWHMTRSPDPAAYTFIRTPDTLGKERKSA
ncbi:NAD(P)-binding domain-containing protein [Frigidibacter albus]|uniref:NAD(P)-binding domain-containing protein n=1 Tax=Frigidibacter albus TaxID=1465486 RepID=A0A6L8VL60_9RHOB|nr:NAD(P)/FAD-dependent oxidoreductase [Frigidibacter albus]MZQ90953.1 NAD(P)-binding domain-containing protein [Frigidibacter albus]NBE32838.1 NAD(P)-binding domain-containing protein [Frigidibacter albus]GGH61779.1 monooxygenase [Frigidibacter albus]